MKRLLSCIYLFSLYSQNVQAHEKKPWVYFDLGDTVVRTKDMKHLKYMRGAREYMDELKREGFNIGIISNIPENWGMDYDEKLLSLKKVIQDGWDEPAPFDWSVYDEIILPLNNNEMKPSPALFIKAITKSESCPSVYIGESPKEIVASKMEGMAAKLFVEDENEIYIPIGSMKTYIATNYKRDYDKKCM